MVMSEMRLFQKPEEQVPGLKRQITAMREKVVNDEIEETVRRETSADSKRRRPQRIVQPGDQQPDRRQGEKD